MPKKRKQPDKRLINPKLIDTVVREELAKLPFYNLNDFLAIVPDEATGLDDKEHPYETHTLVNYSSGSNRGSGKPTTLCFLIDRDERVIETPDIRPYDVYLNETMVKKGYDPKLLIQIMESIAKRIGVKGINLDFMVAHPQAFFDMGYTQTRDSSFQKTIGQ